ncbi:MAG: 50S ribosomal protein L6 [Thermodesulfovibrionales bacterium]|nr:50S ribosomal protein L6 [Thermodesulfovibrionales bacterium]MDP3113058.1 50S ribosomal protein L6 [Thermodesulfovibrionales bacterium]
MSRIGKKPIDIPKGVDIKVDDATVKVKGPKGETASKCPTGIKVSVNEGKILVERSSEEKNVRALHGLTRSLIANMVSGVSTGYQRVLEISGTGYRAQVQGNKLVLALGYSHPVEFELPAGVKAAVDQKQVQITLTGIDKQQIGQISANLKALRPPDAYKGKGVRYAGQRLKLKVGKAGKK